MRAAIVRAVARRGAAGLATREAFKDELIRRLGFARRAILAVARRAVARGALAAEDDVFYLQLGELEAALAAGRSGAPDLRAAVAARRARRDADLRAAEPPPVLVLGDAGWVAPELPGAGGGGGDGAAIVGLPASGGRAEGVACVRAHGDLRPLPPGAILVAPFTDPGWTVLLAAAGGVVTDFGGVLSHASVIARELGVPAVVNCRDATRRIPDGAWVVLDGDRGTVEVREREPG